MKSIYPFLVGEIAKRGIKKKEIAESTEISYKAFYNKMLGKNDFSLTEAMTIQKNYFPEIPLETLFQHEPQ